MSDDPNDNPPKKLKLSRDLKGDSESHSPAPAMKLKRASDTTDAADSTPGAASDQPPAKTEQAVEPKPDTPAPAMKLKRASDTTDAADSTPGAASDQPPAKTEQAVEPKPDSPSSKTKLKAQEVKNHNAPPPKKANEHLPKDESETKVEDAIKSINSREEDDNGKTSGKSSILVSVIIILILLAALVGAGFALWKVLQHPSDSTNPAEASTSIESSNSSGPIQKTKSTIAKIPEPEVERITSVPSSKITTLNPAPTEPTPPKANYSVEVTKERVSKYLSTIRIDGLRKGERPMVMIEGKTFQVNDVVDVETDLKFNGIRDGRLAFRDQNGIVYLKSF